MQTNEVAENVQSSSIAASIVLDDETIRKNADIELLRNRLPGYEEAIDRLLGKGGGLHWDLTILRNLIDSSDLIKEYAQVQVIVENLAAAKNILDIRVGNLYFTLFKKTFHNLSFANKKPLMQFFYNKYGSPSWETMDAEFGGDLTLAVNKLFAGSKQNKQIRQLAGDFAWFFVLSLKRTWWSLLSTVLRTPAVIPVVVKLLRQLEPVRTAVLSPNGPPLIAIGILRLLEKNQVLNESHEDNWASLVCALMSAKVWTLDEISGERVSFPVNSVISSTEGMWYLVLPIFKLNPRLGLKTLMLLLDDGLQDNIHWSDKINLDDGSGGVCAVEIFAVLFDVFLESLSNQSTGENRMADLSLRALRLLISFWKEEEIRFPQEETDSLQRRFKNCGWPVRCVVDGYLRGLSEERLLVELPTCFFKVFDIPANRYRPINCNNGTENHCELVCALTGLFEMSALSIEIALEVADDASFGYLSETMKLGDLNDPLEEAIAAALVKSHSLHEWRNLVDLCAAIFVRLAQECGSEEDVRLKSYSLGIRTVAPAAHLCEAIGRIVMDSPSLAVQYVRNSVVVIHDSIMDRVLEINDRLGKFIALECLFVNACRLATIDATTAEVPLLLAAILKTLRNERIQFHTEVITAAAHLLPVSIRESVMRQLTIVH